MRRAIAVLGFGALMVAATPSTFGGWAVVTFDDVPEYLVVGQPITLTFKIRQHGQTLLNDRSPSITLRNENQGFLSRLLNRNSADATRTDEGGEYQATITASTVGETTLVVNTDVHGWKSKLLPIPVRSSDGRAGALEPQARGRQLFAAMGCATCHAKRDDPAFADWRFVGVGPQLTGRTYPDEWLAAKIRNPEQFANPSSMDRMPQLDVADRHIAALVSYINGHDRTVVTDGGA